MTGNAKYAETDWEAIDEEEEGLDSNDTVDKAVEQFLCEDGVLFYELRKVIQARC